MIVQVWSKGILPKWPTLSDSPLELRLLLGMPSAYPSSLLLLCNIMPCIPYHIVPLWSIMYFRVKLDRVTSHHIRTCCHHTINSIFGIQGSTVWRITVRNQFGHALILGLNLIIPDPSSAPATYMYHNVPRPSHWGHGQEGREKQNSPARIAERDPRRILHLLYRVSEINGCNPGSTLGSEAQWASVLRFSIFR